jgi:hypothetical protein
VAPSFLSNCERLYKRSLKRRLNDNAESQLALGVYETLLILIYLKFKHRSLNGAPRRGGLVLASKFVHITVHQLFVVSLCDTCRMRWRLVANTVVKAGKFVINRLPLAFQV